MPLRYGKPKPWAHLYNTAAWKRIRHAQLSAEPLCVMCLKDGGRVTPATVCDHIKPHKGNEALFFGGQVQSLCKRHHDSDKQMLEKSGKTKVRIGLDGYPIETAEQQRKRIGDLIRPSWIKPSRISLTIVCGPAGGGKSTYIKSNAKRGDIIIDMDAIRTELGIGINEWDSSTLERSLVRRNAMLAALATAKAPRAWLIVSAAPSHERDWWRKALKPEQTVVVIASAAVCIDRISKTREGERAARSIKAASKWWREYTRSSADVVIETHQQG